MPVVGEKPYMGKVEVDLAEPGATERLARIKDTIRELGISSTLMEYPGHTVVYYGQENAVERRAEEESPVRKIDFVPISV